jgi:flagellar hook-basal body complex protein FliE
MAMAGIQPLPPAGGLTSVEPLKPSQKGSGDFQKLVGNFTKDFNDAQQQAADEVAKLASGKADNVHQVMIALGKAEVSFNYMMEVRNRLLDAYKEVMRMPI